MITDKGINMRPIFREQLRVPPMDFGKVVSDPSSIINLIEVPRKEVDDISRALAKIQEIEAAKLVAKRFISIAENTRFSFWPSN